MAETAALLVPFLTAVIVAVIAKLQFSKKADKNVLGPIPPNVTVYSLLAQQDAKIAELLQLVRECQNREKLLLQRLGLEP